ncbi:hypothetical protein EVAR_20691_1 [Eumeta japonica]|uniref:Uncharacterized protein n=1 Tax=Eumeta variegata TaxID=151549 RepID=A0A4C1V8T3_EUMVA|nr:hypothetical protein EVAR_20691_1 [Eumeta japonica]
MITLHFITEKERKQKRREYITRVKKRKNLGHRKMMIDIILDMEGKEIVPEAETMMMTVREIRIEEGIPKEEKGIETLTETAVVPEKRVTILVIHSPSALTPSPLPPLRYPIPTQEASKALVTLLSIKVSKPTDKTAWDDDDDGPIKKSSWDFPTPDVKGDRSKHESTRSSRPLKDNKGKLYENTPRATPHKWISSRRGPDVNDSDWAEAEKKLDRAWYNMGEAEGCVSRCAPKRIYEVRSVVLRRLRVNGASP